MCKYEEQCDNWDFRMELATKNMNILADALRKTEPTISKMEQVDKDINVRSKDEPQTKCHRDEEYACHVYPNKGDCNNCKLWYKDEPQTERSE